MMIRLTGTITLLFVLLAFTFIPSSFAETGFLFEFDGKSGGPAFEFPRAVAVDTNGRILVVDAVHNTVQVYDSERNFLFDFDGNSNGGPGFDAPYAITTDDNNRILVSEEHTVQVYNEEGEFLFDFNGSGNNNLGQNFQFPSAIATNSNDEILVVDALLALVQVYDNNGNFLFNFDGENGGTQFDYPYGIAVNSSDEIFVSDYDGQSLQKFDSTGNYISNFGTGVDIERPLTVAVDSNGRIILNDGTGTIHIFDTSGIQIDEFINADDGLLVGIVATAIDSSDNILLVNSQLDTIHIFDNNGEFLFDFNGANGSERFTDPYGVTTDSTDRIIVADLGLSSIQVYDNNGDFQFSFDDTGVWGAPLVYPFGITTDSTDRIIVADAGSDLVHVYDSEGNYQFELDGSASDSSTFSPAAVAVDSHDRIFVTNISTNTVYVYDSDGTFQFELNGRDSGGIRFKYLTSIAVDSTDRIIVGERDLFQVFDNNGNFLFPFDGSDDGGTPFTSLESIAVDSNDNIILVDENKIYVYDSEGNLFFEFDDEHYVYPYALAVDSNNRIIVSDIDTGFISVFEGFPHIESNDPEEDLPVENIVDGDLLFTFDGISTGGQQLTNLFGIATDSTNRIIVSDTTLALIQVYDSEGKFLFDFDGEGGDGLLVEPTAVAVDSTDRIIVAEASLDLIIVFDPLGNPIFEFNGVVGGGTGIDIIRSIAVDSNDRIIVADRIKVHVFDSTGRFQFDFNSLGEIGSETFGSLESIAVDSNDNIIVADEGRGAIFVFDSNGYFLFEFNGYDRTGSETFGSLRSITVDSNDNIIVADIGTNTVQVYDSEGKFLMDLDVAELEIPYGITVDSTNRIIVADINTGFISVFEGFIISDDTGGSDVDPPSTKKKGNGGCADCTPPTLGLDINYKRIVENGFSYNGNSIQVDKWHTPYPLINATVGETNTVEIIVYENGGVNNMKLVQFGLGATEIGQPLSDLEVLIEVWLDPVNTNNFIYNNDIIGMGEIIINDIAIEEIIINDKDNLIDNSSVNAISHVVKCGNDSSSTCAKVILEYSYREPTINHIMVVNVMDTPRNSQNFYFNDGIQVVGDSMNPVPYYIMQNKHASQQTEDLTIVLFRTDKINHIWATASGIEYLQISENRFDRITPAEPYKCTDPPLSEISVPTRQNCHFRDLTELWTYN